MIREGTGRMPGFAHLGRGVNEIVDFLLTGKDAGSAVAKDDRTGRSIAMRATFCFAIPTAIRRSRRHGARSTRSI